jgi:transcriptional regulator with XRE-family HTH domain
MAIKAHLDQLVPTASQRSAPRRALRLYTSGFAAYAGEANVTIHNISAAGLLIETGVGLGAGERLTLDLPEAGPVTAIIVWRSEHLYGCAFEQALGAGALAAAQLQGFAPDPEPAVQRPTPSGSAGGEALGTRLNRLRREAGLTLADVAATLGVSKPTVWAWEKGKARPLPERLDAIAQALRVSPEAIAETAAPSELISGVIEDCRLRIAEASGTPVSRVRIMIEL